MRLVIVLCLFFGTSLTAHAEQFRKAGDSEFSFSIPYNQGSQIEFEGGATADVSKDHGFGFGFNYFYTPQISWRVDTSWHSSQYVGKRKLEDDNSEQTFAHVYDGFSFTVGGEYYLTQGTVAPFVRGSLGWSYINSNIASRPPTGGCWWDPWWGYTCSVVQPTYSDTAWRYGAALGVRVAMGESAFVKASYSQDWVDISNTRGTPKSNTFTIEVGYKINTSYGSLF